MSENQLIELELGGSRRKKFRAKRAQHSTRTCVLACDNRCSDKARSFWQFASVVVDDVKESYTVNLCQQCSYERLTVVSSVFTKD